VGVQIGTGRIRIDPRRIAIERIRPERIAAAEPSKCVLITAAY
jgi:hypothetical protein